MKRKILLFSLLSILILSVVVIAYQVKNKLTQSSLHAHISSNISAIAAAFHSEGDNEDSILRDILTSEAEGWQFVTDEEYNQIIIELAKSYDLDFWTVWNPSQTLVDPWGNRFEIAYQKSGDRFYNGIVISKGPDGIYDTDDDIVSMYGVRPPEKPDE